MYSKKRRDQAACGWTVGSAIILLSSLVVAFFSFFFFALFGCQGFPGVLCGPDTVGLDRGAPAVSVIAGVLEGRACPRKNSQGMMHLLFVFVALTVCKGASQKYRKARPPTHPIIFFFGLFPVSFHTKINTCPSAGVCW